MSQGRLGPASDKAMRAALLTDPTARRLLGGLLVPANPDVGTCRAVRLHQRAQGNCRDAVVDAERGGARQEGAEGEPGNRPCKDELPRNRCHREDQRRDHSTSFGTWTLLVDAIG